jgi:hypothetical protein
MAYGCRAGMDFGGRAEATRIENPAASEVRVSGQATATFGGGTGSFSRALSQGTRYIGKRALFDNRTPTRPLAVHTCGIVPMVGKASSIWFPWVKMSSLGPLAGPRIVRVPRGC